MLSDARILAYVVRDISRVFTIPRNRRDLAAHLRRVRTRNGRKAATLVLAELSARALCNSADCYSRTWPSYRDTTDTSNVYA